MRADHRQERLPAGLRRALPLAAAGTAGCLLALLVAGTEALAAALTVFDAASLAPAPWATCRSPSLAGLSGPSWGLRATVAGGWITFGLAIRHPLSAGWAYVMGPAAVLMYVRIRHDRTGARATALLFEAG